MKNIILIVLIVLGVFNNVNLFSQCNPGDVSILVSNGTCMSNASVNVVVPNVATYSNPTGWTVILADANHNPLSSRALQSNGTILTPFGGLSAGNYNIRITNGVTVCSWIPTVITTSYQSIVMNVTGTPTTCASSTPYYAPDGTITLTKISGGIGDFVYSIATSSGTQTSGTTTATSHTFSGLNDGDTVVCTITDLALGNAGCQSSTTSTFILSKTTSPQLAFREHGFVFSKACGVNCDKISFDLRITPGSVQNDNFLQLSGNAQISVNNAPFEDLEYVSYGLFNYSPLLDMGDVIQLRLISACGDTLRTTFSAHYYGILADGGGVFNNSTCEMEYSLRAIHSFGNYGYSYNQMCDSIFSLQIERYDDILNVWDLEIDTNTQGYFNVSGPGLYRYTFADYCDTVVIMNNIPSVSIAWSSEYYVSEFTSILGGTSTIGIGNGNGIETPFNVFNSGFNNLPRPLEITIEPIPFQPSVTIGLSEPLNLNDTYTGTFPFTRYFGSTGDRVSFIGDLPLGSYKVSSRSLCINQNNDTIVMLARVDSVDLVRPATYVPEFDVRVSCSNSNSIRWNLNATNVYTDWISCQLIDNVTNIVVGTLSSNANSGSFNNLPSGSYRLAFRDESFAVGRWIGGYSWARSSVAYEYDTLLVIPEYEDVNISTNVFSCTENSGLVNVDIISGTPVYPLIYNLFDSSGTVVLQSDTAFNSSSSLSMGIIYNDLSSGNYVLRVGSGVSALLPNGCFTFESNFEIQNSQNSPSIFTNDAIICSTVPSIDLSLPLDTTLWDITWFDASGVVIGNGVSHLEVNPGVGNTQYIASFQLNSNVGCLSPPLLSDTIQIEVLAEPSFSGINLVGDTICVGATGVLSILNPQPGVSYEVYKSPGSDSDTLSPRLIGVSTGIVPLDLTISGTDLQVGDNLFMVKSYNAVCSGNFLDTIANVFVYNNLAPVITTCISDSSVYVSTTACTYEVPDYTTNSQLDFQTILNGSELTITQTPLMGSIVPQGDTTIWIFATDLCGRQDSCSFVLSVLDSIHPVFTNCPTNITISADSGLCSAVVNWPTLLATDNCGTPIITSSHTSGFSFPVGTTIVSYVATDESGNSSTCSFEVTVTDDELPIIIFNDIPLVVCEGSPVNWQFTTSDNCGVSTVVSSHTSGSVFPVGTTTVLYTITDIHDNVTRDSFDVIVVELPTVQINEQSSKLICNGTSVELQLQSPITSYTYNWYHDGVLLYQGPYLNITSVDYSHSGAYTVISTDTNGCISQASDIQLTIISCDITIYEAFSPNGDGKNEFFYVEGLEHYENSVVTIFNRWGTQVYHSDNYKNDWDGRSQNAMNINGDVLPEGTYFYLLQLGGKEQPNSGEIYKGYVYLKR